MVTVHADHGYDFSAGGYGSGVNAIVTRNAEGKRELGIGL